MCSCNIDHSFMERARNVFVQYGPFVYGKSAKCVRSIWTTHLWKRYSAKPLWRALYSVMCRAFQCRAMLRWSFNETSRTVLFTFYCPWPCSVDLLTLSSCWPVEKLAWSFSFSFFGNCGQRAGYIDSMFTAQSTLSHYSTPRCSLKPFAVRRSALAKRQFNRRSLDVDFARTRAYILLRARLDWSTRVIRLLFYNTRACAWLFEILLHYTSLSWASLLLSLTVEWSCMHGMRGNDDDNLILFSTV